MPSAERRAARTNQLIRDYKSARKAFEKRVRHRKARLRHSFQLAKAQLEGAHHYHSNASLESLSELSHISLSATSLAEGADSELDLDSDASNSGDYNWDNILGDNWRTGSIPSHLEFDNSESPATSPSGSVGDSDEDSFTGLLPVGIDSDLDAGSSSADSLVSDLLDFDADDELKENSDTDGEDLDEENKAASLTPGKWDRLRRWVLNQIIGMYATRYELPRDGLPCGPSYLHHVLTRLKTEREDHFHEALRINPTTFDALVSAIEDDPIFTNNSNNSQMPIEEQLAITLY